MENLALTPEEEAELNKNFPVEENPSEPPTPPADTPKETPEPPAGTSPEDILKALQGLGTQLEELKKPENHPSPEEKKEEPTWKPKDWEAVAQRARIEAERVIEEKQKAAEAAQKDSEKKAAELDTEINSRVSELEKVGRLPKIVNRNSDTDPGVIAQRELFALAHVFNTMDFNKIMDNIDVAHKANQFFDHKTFKWTEKVINPGKDAPIGSSNHVTTPSKGAPDYKMIHGRSLDELARIGMQE